MSPDQQLQRQTQKERQTQNQRDGEALWLQKTLFALGKARETRMKQSEATGEDLSSLIVLDDGTRVPIDTLRKIIQQRVDVLLGSLGRHVRGPRG